MKRLNVILLLFGLSAPLAAWAETAPVTPTQPLTQEAAVEFALAHNQAYRAAFEDVSASGEKVNEARADFFPKVDGSYRYMHWQDQPFAAIPGLLPPDPFCGTDRQQVGSRHRAAAFYRLPSGIKLQGKQGGP